MAGSGVDPGDSPCGEHTPPDSRVHVSSGSIRQFQDDERSHRVPKKGERRKEEPQRETREETLIRTTIAM